MVTVLVVGCNGAGQVSQQAKQFMERPKIFFTSGHSYGGNEWLGKDIEVLDDFIKASSDSIFLEVIFDTEINYNSIKGKIKLIGSNNYEIEQHYNNKNALRIIARDVEHGKTYKLHIPKSIEDINGNALEDNIEIEIVLDEDPKAFYTFNGQEITIDNLGEVTDDFRNVHFSLPVTNINIDFIVEFTKKVNKESVENSIRKSLNNEGKISFEWTNQQKLRLSIENLPSNEEYLVSMEEANDENNTKIIGNLFFTVLEPSQLGYINIHTRQDRLIKEFTDVPYMVVPSEDYEQYFIVADYAKKYLLDIKKNIMVELPDLKYAFGFSYYEWYFNWLNSHTVLAFEGKTNSIFTHNFMNDEVQKLFTIPLKIEPEIYDMKLSPDKNKIAITNSHYSMDLSVFSLEGEILYQGEAIANNNLRENSPSSMYLQWLDDNTIIFQDKGDVAKLDISTGTKETIIKDAQEPIVCQNSSFVLVKKYEDKEYVLHQYLYDITEGEGYSIGTNISNFIFISKNELLYNDGQSIVLFSIPQNTKEIIGKGRIIGVSPKRDKLYYLNNYNNVYNFYY